MVTALCAGVPPSWAQRSNAKRSAAVDAGSKDCIMETWRRKYLWFPVELGDDGLGYPVPHWPPYYGSWSRTRLRPLHSVCFLVLWHLIWPCMHCYIHFEFWAPSADFASYKCHVEPRTAQLKSKKQIVIDRHQILSRYECLSDPDQSMCRTGRLSGAASPVRFLSTL